MENDNIDFEESIATIHRLSKVLSGQNEQLRKDKKTIHIKACETKKLKEIIEASLLISYSIDKDKVIKNIISICHEIFGCVTSIWLTEDNPPSLVFAHSSNTEDNEKMNGLTLKIGQGMAGRIWKHGRELIDNKIEPGESTFSRETDKKFNVMTNNIMGTTMTVNGKIIGVVQVLNKPGGFTNADMNYLKTISLAGANAINNAELYEKATKDEKTGLYKLWYFREKTMESFKRKENYSLIFSDIDHFKNFNDTYGHEAGDFVLKKVADIFMNETRDIDVVSRFGGEEYIVFLPNTDKNNSEIVGNRIRKKIEESVINYQGQELKVTVSLGVADLSANPLNNEELEKRSDEAMYFSKKNGRNRVTVYDSETVKETSEDAINQLLDEAAESLRKAKKSYESVLEKQYSEKTKNQLDKIDELLDVKATYVTFITKKDKKHK